MKTLFFLFVTLFLGVLSLPVISQDSIPMSETIVMGDLKGVMIQQVDTIGKIKSTTTTIIINELRSNILGTLSIWTYLSAFFFVFLGLVVRNGLKIKKAVQHNKATPDKLSWRYWFANNFFAKLNSFGVGMIIVFICLRFSQDWFHYSVSMSIAFFLGLCWDWVVDYIRKKQKLVGDQIANLSNPPTTSNN